MNTILDDRERKIKLKFKKKKKARKSAASHFSSSINQHKCWRGGNLVAALEWDGSDDDLVVDGSECSSDEWSDPEDPLQSRRHQS